MRRMEQGAATGLTEEARRARKRFMCGYRRMMREAKRVSLTVLVWGPSPDSKSPIAKKRVEIRDKLIELGHNAMFSEEVDGGESELSAKSKEFAQAKAADLIIILPEDAPGAIGEAHDFCEYPDIAPKVFVLVPKKYRQGYSGRGLFRDLEKGYGAVCWYGEGDMRSCEVLRRAVARVEARRQMIYRGGRHCE